MGKWEELRKQLREWAFDEDDDYASFAMDLLDKMDYLDIKYAEYENELGYKPNEHRNGK